MDLRKRAKQLKEDVPAVFLALKYKETPIRAKILSAMTVAYALSPIDLIPDFIPILGYLDDIIILSMLVALTAKMIPKEIWIRSKEQSKDSWKEGKPKKWYYAVPIMIFWLLIVYMILKLLLD